MKTVLGAALLLNVIITGLPLLGQHFPAVSENQRIEMLKHPNDRPVRMVLDTDTYNEIDDQFALVYALISPSWTSKRSMPLLSRIVGQPGREMAWKEVMKKL